MTLARHLAVGAATPVAFTLALVAHAGCSSRGSAEPVVSEVGVASVDAGADAGSDAGSEEESLPPIPPLCTFAGLPAPATGDTLVWSDEFDGAAVDTSRWNVFDEADPHSTILSAFAPANLETRDGLLRVITTQGSSDPNLPYTAGRIDTAHKFQRTYGRMDVRARFPSAPGLWYAIWARGWDAAFPEIDIEVLAKTTPEIWMVNHWAGGALPADERRAFAKVPGYDATQFHVYSVEWKPGTLEWRIDGTSVFTAVGRGVPTSPIQWTINTWVGGWGGAVAPTTPFPNTFEVDWMRVYRVDGLVADPAIRVTRFDRHGGAAYNMPPYMKRADELQVEVANFDEACFHVELWEGERRLAARDAAPFRFPLAGMKVGPHAFKLVATDGTRTATVDANTYVE